MSDQQANEPMLDMYIFETTQNIEQLEKCILESENSGNFTQEAINEIFRIMHTIKGSSAMMLFDNISLLAHSMEDLFYFIRNQKPQILDYCTLSNLILCGIDFMKAELYKVKSNETLDGDATDLITNIKDYLLLISQRNSYESQNFNSQTNINIEQKYYIAQNKMNTHLHNNYFKATVFFEEGCEMENIRSYTIIHHLRDIVYEAYYHPSDIIESDLSIKLIKEEGFTIYFNTDKTYEEMNRFFNKTIFLKDLELVQLVNREEYENMIKSKPKGEECSQSIVLEQQANVNSEQNIQLKDINVHRKSVTEEKGSTAPVNQSMISVNVKKLDQLMDLVGEMVIAESMVLQNPDLIGLELENFHKASRQLHKITSELQDIVMSIRMVPLSNTFHKMHRIVRDMSKKLNKEVQLELLGEETEVDKNIIEHISDPIMHLVRNSIDHGIESVEEREVQEKSKIGKVILEAKNVGSDVIITVKDDGRGLNKEKILKKARESNLLYKTESDLTDKEICNLIFLPGFSTKEKVTEFSGRGVGMDVVTKNIEAVGGMTSVDSVEGIGSSFIIKIPLTLAIIDGMNIQVGGLRFTIPTTAIKESFQSKHADIVKDPDGNEMIIVRGQCYSLLRLHEYFHVKTEVTNFSDGIFIMVEQNDKKLCLFADRLLGQQQVVVKSLPQYITDIRKKQGLSGCTLLGDGNISLILDIGGLSQRST